MDNDYNKLCKMRVFHEHRPEDIGQLFDRSVCVMLNVKGLSSATVEAMIGYEEEEDKMVFLINNSADDGNKDEAKALAIDLKQDLVVRTIDLSGKNKNKVNCRYTKGIRIIKESPSDDASEPIKLLILFSSELVRTRFYLSFIGDKNARPLHECLGRHHAFAFQRQPSPPSDHDDNRFPSPTPSADTAADTALSTASMAADTAAPPLPKSLKMHSETHKDIRVYIMTWNHAVRKLLENEETEATLARNIPVDCDLYVLGVQECIDPGYFRFFQKILPHCTDLSAKSSRLFGRGDRSFISPKFTGIGVLVANRLLPRVKIRGSKCAKIGSFEGSKGSSCLAMTIDETSLVFVSSHYPVHNPKYRSLCYQYIDERLGRALGHPSFSLADQFHHVFSVGDFNYKLQDIDLRTARRFLQSRSRRLLWEHDTMSKEIALRASFDGFREPLAGANFFPTYKKREKRPEAFRAADVDENYVTVFKKPWYKGFEVVEKIPAFTDRIMVRSVESLESDVWPVQDGAGSHYYRCFEPDVVGSDHSAVMALFNVRIRSSTQTENPSTLVLKIHNIDLLIGNESILTTDLRVTVLFPALFEDGNEAISQTVAVLALGPAPKSNAPSPPKKGPPKIASPPRQPSPTTSLRKKMAHAKKGKLLRNASDPFATDKKSPKRSEKSYTGGDDADCPATNSLTSMAPMLSDPGSDVSSNPPQSFNQPQRFRLGDVEKSFVKATWSTRSKAPTIHALVKFYSDKTIGQCTIPLSKGAFEAGETAVIEREVLSSALPIMDHGGRVLKARQGFSKIMILTLRAADFSYSNLAIFSSTYYPYSFKIIWSPIVDSVFSRKVGRRRSWIIPTQFFMSLIFISLYSSALPCFFGGFFEGGENLLTALISGKRIFTLTAVFMALFTLTATQDIALDAWGLTLLPEEIKYLVSTCQTAGLTIGNVLGYNIVIMLTSPKIEKTLLGWSLPKTVLNALPLNLGTFCAIFGIAAAMMNFGIIMFVSESSKKKSDGKTYSLRKAYMSIYWMVKLECVKKLIMVALTSVAPFAANMFLVDSYTIEKNVVSKETLAGMDLLSVPVSLILTTWFGKSQDRDFLKSWMTFFKVFL